MADHNLELVGWQQRWLDPEEGPSGWAFCDEAAAKVYKLKPGYEVRPVYALAQAEPQRTPAWWRDGLTATLMREGINKHRAREIADGYWQAYCEIGGNDD